MQQYKTVCEVSKISGCSVRTLHHYDAIGLLSPSKVTQAGYRLYDDAALARLQTILFFKELQFPLKEIKAILDDPGFVEMEALQQQIVLLEAQRRRLDKLIDLARETLRKGGYTMDLSAFDKTETERLTQEAKARWGHTEAWSQFEQKNRETTEKQQAEYAAELMKIFSRFGELKTGDPQGKGAQALVAALREHITAHYYDCTVPILQGLGQMYLCDDRMKRSIDKAGGDGTAAFAAEAISAYCRSH